MKISLVIEADSPEDFRKALDAAFTRKVEWVHAADPVADVIVNRAMQEQEPTKPTEPPATPPAPSPEEEPKPAEPEKPAEQETPPEPPVAAKKRGRRTKAEMQAAQAAAAPVAAPEAKPAAIKASIFNRDDLTAVFREYVTKYGYSAAASDVSKLLQQNLGAGVRKSSDVSDDAIPQAIAIVKAAVVENPFKREVAANG